MLEPSGRFWKRSAPSLRRIASRSAAYASTTIQYGLAVPARCSARRSRQAVDSGY